MLIAIRPSAAWHLLQFRYSVVTRLSNVQLRRVVYQLFLDWFEGHE